MIKIIVPIDFSEESLGGLDFALMLADKMKAGIEMIHVITGDEISSQNSNYESEQKFKNILARYSSRNLPLDFTIKEGKIPQEVVSEAEAYDEALIVLATHGRSGLEEFFIGNNAFRIASISKYPVISVRNRNVPETIRKIVMPLNITFEAREKVPITSKIAKLFNAELHLVTVRTTNDKSVENKLLQYSKQVRSYFDSQNIRVITEHLKGKNLTDITREYADSVKADLISIMLEQEVGMSNLFQGSYAHQMIRSSDIPVLTYPNYQITIPTEDLRTQGIPNE